MQSRIRSHNRLVSGFCFSGAQSNEGTKESSGERMVGGALREGQKQTFLPPSVAPDPVLTPDSQCPSHVAAGHRAWHGICASHQNDEYVARGHCQPRSVWEAIFQAGRVQLDVMCCLCLYGTTEPHYRNSSPPNITGKANQTGLAVAFGKPQRPLVCAASELHGQLNHSQGKSCLSTKGHGYDLSVILCQYVFLTKYHIKGPLYGLRCCLLAQGWERKNLWAGSVIRTI